MDQNEALVPLPRYRTAPWYVLGLECGHQAADHWVVIRIANTWPCVDCELVQGRAQVRSVAWRCTVAPDLLTISPCA